LKWRRRSRCRNRKTLSEPSRYPHVESAKANVLMQDYVGQFVDGDGDIALLPGKR
jgi:hypothetical protein